MVDTARQLLDELMGRNRNLDPLSAQCRKICWDDPEFCLYFLVKFCPHDLFVNTRADLGQCTRVHDEEAKRLYEEARPSLRKRHFEDEFMRFSNHMLSEVDRKIAKGKQRLQLMNKSTGAGGGSGGGGGGESAGGGGSAAVYVSKYQEQLNNLDARIRKLIGEAEEAGNRGDVDQAQGLMTLCDQLKDEKEALERQHEVSGAAGAGAAAAGAGAEIDGEKQPGSPQNGENGAGREEREGSGATGGGRWRQKAEFTSSEKQMEVCEVCGAFLIVGDAQQRLEDHLTGKQHQGYSRLRKAVDEMYEKRKQERDEEDRQRDEERRKQGGGGGGGDGHPRHENKFSRRRDDFDDSRRSSRRDDRDRRSGDGGGSGVGRRGSSGERRDRSDRDSRSDRSGHRHHRRDDRGEYRESHRDRNRSRSKY